MRTPRTKLIHGFRHFQTAKHSNILSDKDHSEWIYSPFFYLSLLTFCVLLASSISRTRFVSFLATASSIWTPTANNTTASWLRPDLNELRPVPAFHVVTFPFQRLNYKEFHRALPPQAPVQHESDTNHKMCGTESNKNVVMRKLGPKSLSKHLPVINLVRTLQV
jgi:hypothetical protein